jgi:hypothetical protein
LDMKRIHTIMILVFALGITGCQHLGNSENPVLSHEEMVEKSINVAIGDIAMDKASGEGLFEAGYFSDFELQLRAFSKGKGKKSKLFDWHDGLRYNKNQCPNVSIDSTDSGYPVTITLDYGSSTELQNGTILSGVIEIVLSGPKNTNGTTRTITYKGYSVDTIQVDGVVMQIFNGAKGKKGLSETESDLTFTFANGTVIERTAERQIEWTSGLDTPGNQADDVYQITGKVEVTTSNNESYSRVIVEPLVKVADCRHFVSGVVQITSNGEIVSTLDYGDGTCDNMVILTTQGETYEIDLKGPKAKAVNKGKKNE